MKINISGLMSMISEYDKELTTLSYNLKKEVYNVSTQELNGTVTVTIANNSGNTKDYHIVYIISPAIKPPLRRLPEL